LVLYLAELLEVPLRERNALLIASGYAPTYSNRNLDDHDSGMPFVRDAISRLLAGHEPYPALVIDRYWNLVDRNRTTNLLVQGVAADLLGDPVNVLRMALHPAGMAPRIVNFAEWSGYLMRRLDHQILVTGDRDLITLATEVRSFPGVQQPDAAMDEDPGEWVVVPLRLRYGRDELRLLNMVATFGTAVDVTAAELIIESFYPADSTTAGVLGGLMGG
jgi:hypothetical protein